MSDRLGWLREVSPEARRWLAHEIRLRLETDRLQDYAPYPKQWKFHALGQHFPERMLRAGNQYGKTLSASAELAMHAVGEYPDWWPGKRFDRPILAWVTGKTGSSVRDLGQSMLLGDPGNWGTGWIPKRCLTGVYGRAHGVSNLFDYYRVKHSSGGSSILRFRYYEQGREAWQGPSVDCLWLDEEPPKDIFAEAQARTVATRGLLMLTFTPLLGRSEVVMKFLSPEERGTSRVEVRMRPEDAYHMGTVEELKDKYDRHEWEARIFAEPAMGEGLIFPVLESEFLQKPFDVPDWWPVIAGMDFGFDHPTAAVKLAWDRETDVVYVIREYRVKRQTPGHHAIALKGWGKELQFAWPHDGERFQAGTGGSLADDYRKGGLKMFGKHAHFAPGGSAPATASGSVGRATVSVERGLGMMLERLETGRLRVFSTCPMWLEERKLYHRKDGKVVKKDDDLMDATRYGLMMLRFARDARPRRQPRIEQNWQA